jgi:protease-4
MASALTGDGVAPETSVDLQTSVASRGFPEPVGLSLGRYAVRVRMEDTPDPRDHVDLLRGLWSLSREPRVDAVVLELRAEPGATLAHVEELRDAVLELRQSGKRVLCHLEDADLGALYLCAAANQTWINPVGGVHFAGLKARYTYFARLLEKLGIRAEAIHIGEHKSAPERFTRDGSTDVSRQDKIDLLQQTERHVTEGLASGRKMSFARVRALAKEGPFMAQQAKDAGLVDGLAFDDEVDSALTKLLGRRTRLQRDDRVAPAPDRFAPQPSIALVYVEGDMIDGRTRSTPLIGAQVSGSYTVAEAIAVARESPLVKAVVLRVESPGGSSTAADVIWRQVKLTARVKPVIVSMGGYAASGGYYISAPAARIFANPSTLTGSIGVYYAKADASQLLDRIGVDIEVYKTTERADAESLYRPFTESERLQLERSLKQFYDVFLERVAGGRKLSKDAVDKVARGRVWTGEQARQHGLVDEVGGLRQALEFARRAANLSEAAPIVELPKLPSSWLGRVLGIPGISGSSEAPLDALLPSSLRDVAANLVPFLMYSSHVPLMRLELVAVPP